jgi:hypothetical protein
VTPDQYLAGIVRNVKAPTGPSGPGEQIRRAMLPYIQEWAGVHLYVVTVSGSYAKGTAVRGDTDVDLFISMRESLNMSLMDIYNSLATYLKNKSFAVRRQNVSIGVTYNGLKIDLVPARKQGAVGSDHSICLSKRATWMKTNVDTHIRTIDQSGKQDVIVLLKRWRDLFRLEFPSFCLELATVRVLSGTSLGLAGSFTRTLEFFRDTLPGASLLDPANSNNDVAADLSASERRLISQQAARSRAAASWGEIVW